VILKIKKIYILFWENILVENNIDVNIFKPIITNEDKTHLYNLVKMVNDIYENRS
jgi:hypothetical protein